jgi:hypothetical protein
LFLIGERQALRRGAGTHRLLFPPRFGPIHNVAMNESLHEGEQLRAVRINELPAAAADL